MPSTKNSKKEKKEFNMDIVTLQVKSARQFNNGRVGFTLECNGITIYNMIAFPYNDKEGNEQWGVSFPQKKGSDGKYYNEVWFPINEEVRKDILDMIDEVLE